MNKNNFLLKKIILYTWSVKYVMNREIIVQYVRYKNVEKKM